MAGRWNEIGSFDTSNKKVLSLYGTVADVDGLTVPVNVSSQIKVMIQGNKIMEMHESPAVSGKQLYLEIRFNNAK